VQLQVEETLSPSSVHGFHGGRPDRGVKLEAHLEGAHVLLRFCDQLFGRVEVGNIERKGDARRWVVLIHESP
jgi:hypothetical protein